MTLRAGAAMRFTRLTWLAGAAGAAALALGCGEGHAIFDIDVLSFLGGQGNDTVPYTIPGNTAGTVDNPPVRVTLLKGLGNSTVDSVTLTVAASVENRTDSGTVQFLVFFSSDSAGLYSTTPYAQASVRVVGADTQPLAPAPIPLVADSIFGQDQIFVGIRVAVAVDPPAGPTMAGTLRLTAVRLRIVLQDHLLQ
jgi:hypothetical protein